MNTCAGRLWITAALALSLGAGCSDNGPASKVVPALKESGKEVLATTKEVGSKVGDGLAEAADSLATFSKSVASNVSDTGEAVAKKVMAKMPDVESLVDKAKAKLATGGAEAKALVARLDEKLVALKSGLESLAKSGVNATREAKDAVVNAFNGLIEDIKNAANLNA